MCSKNEYKYLLSQFWSHILILHFFPSSHWPVQLFTERKDKSTANIWHLIKYYNKLSDSGLKYVKLYYDISICPAHTLGWVLYPVYITFFLAALGSFIRWLRDQRAAISESTCKQKKHQQIKNTSSSVWQHMCSIFSQHNQIQNLLQILNTTKHRNVQVAQTTTKLP